MKILDLLSPTPKLVPNQPTSPSSEIYALNIRKIGTFLDPNPPQHERHMCMPQELLHRHSNGAPEE